jgi:protein gp37
MRMASRLQAMGHAAYADTARKSGGRPVWTGVLHLNEDALDVPLRWRKPRKIFVNSMSDLFRDGAPDAFVRRVWAVMGKAPRHIFQILTKRPENMLRMVVENRLPLCPTSGSEHRWRMRITRIA